MAFFPPPTLSIPDLWTSSTVLFALGTSLVILFIRRLAGEPELKARACHLIRLGTLKTTKLLSRHSIRFSNVDKTQAVVAQPADDANSVPKLSKEEGGPSPVTSTYGLLITDELESALAECKAKVQRIARECREQNRKFRDIEFDLEMDKDRCLYGLKPDGTLKPADVRRVTEIFDDPEFFVHGADSNDIVQGALGDCWFLSALSTMSTAKGLVEKFCVARDEEVGVYGFIFWRNNAWVNVVVDDMLFSAVPKYECLTSMEQSIYHYDKDKYNELARKGGKGLYFAKSGDDGETWVPIIEKAYAKLHGDYTSLGGGRASEAIEDLTGGVSVVFRTKDILDPDTFWHEELAKATQDRLFGCSFPGLDTKRNENESATVRGLYGAHAYSILRTLEVKGKRFLVIRNPWGKTEWTGPWSDGSKEWTQEWLKILPELGHVLGDDGEFIMEYGDFLDCWEFIQRTLIFDHTWIMSQLWVQIPPKPDMYPWTFGEAIFRFTLTEASPTLIVLSQVDDRYFSDISGRILYGLEFVVCKRGERELTGTSTYATLYTRSATCELQLEAGEYTVYPRFNRWFSLDKEYYKDACGAWDQRKLSRMLAERTRSRSIAKNFQSKPHEKHIPVSLQKVAEVDVDRVKGELQLIAKPGSSADTQDKDASETEIEIMTMTTVTTTTQKIVTETRKVTVSKEDSGSEDSSQTDGLATTDDPLFRPKPDAADLPVHLEDVEALFVGLRVYTHRNSSAIITSQVDNDAVIGSQSQHATPFV